MEEITTKECARCHRVLPTENFSKKTANKDGLNSYCRECSAIVQKEWRERNLKIGGGGEPNFDSPLAKFKPRELIDELRRRGYRGKLTYTNEIVL